MIDRALSLLREELQTYINLSIGGADVVVDNIGMLETANSDSLTKRIIITLVNVEEESTLKNFSSVKKGFSGTSALYENPPVFLNLYVLVTCNYSGTDYIHALERLSAVVRFFQCRNIFTYPPPTGGISTGAVDIPDLKITLELYTLTFEQINHLWGSLGGRQVPFVMYKLRLIAITERATLIEVPLIDRIDSSLSGINGN